MSDQSNNYKTESSEVLEESKSQNNILSANVNNRYAARLFNNSRQKKIMKLYQSKKKQEDEAFINNQKKCLYFLKRTAETLLGENLPQNEFLSESKHSSSDEDNMSQFNLEIKSPEIKSHEVEMLTVLRKQKSASDTHLSFNFKSANQNKELNIQTMRLAVDPR